MPEGNYNEIYGLGFFFLFYKNQRHLNIHFLHCEVEIS